MELWKGTSEEFLLKQGWKKVKGFRVDMEFLEDYDHYDNVYFESTGNSGCQEGSITIRVTDIDFYDRKRKILWEAKSKVIRFLYHMKNIPRKEQIETTVYFKVKPCKMNQR